METKHSQTPWKIAESTNSRDCFGIISRDGWVADLHDCHGDKLANAAFIVKAVNEYEPNKKTIRDLQKTVEVLKMRSGE